MYFFSDIKISFKNKKFKRFYKELKNLLIKKNVKFNKYRKKLELSNSLLGTILLIIYILLFKSKELKHIYNDFLNIYIKYFEVDFNIKKKRMEKFKKNLNKCKKLLTGSNIFLALLIVLIIILYIFILFFCFLNFCSFFTLFSFL